MATPGPRGGVRDDRVLPLTRCVSLVIIPFLAVAFFVLVPWPGDTGRLFAWDIKPALTAMVLGSVYLGGAYFFFRVVRAKQWHTVKGGFVPVGTFATLMGVATIVHWDKFLHAHVAFWLWAGLYFTTPFLVFFVFLANRKHDAPATPTDLLLPAGASRIIAVLGGLNHVLLGMNAHINLDLPQALLAVITDEEFDVPAIVAKPQRRSPGHRPGPRRTGRRRGRRASQRIRAGIRAQSVAAAAQPAWLAAVPARVA